jgi:hypothetical protein
MTEIFRDSENMVLVLVTEGNNISKMMGLLVSCLSLIINNCNLVPFVRFARFYSASLW